MGGAGMESICVAEFVVTRGAEIFVTGGLLEPRHRELVGPWSYHPSLCHTHRAVTNTTGYMTQTWATMGP